MNINKNETSTGIVISQEVIEKVACVAALEVSGVAGVVANKDIKDIFESKSAKPVRAKVGDNIVEIDINVKLRMGAKIAQVCKDIQINIKNAVQNIANYAVSRVNVHVVDIELNDENKK